MSGKKIAGIVLLVVLVLSAVVLLALPDREGPRFAAGGDAIMLIRLQGAIQGTAEPGLFGAGGITPALVQQRLEAAEQHPRVRAVVIRLDSPGGTVAASQEIASLIADFPLPVVITMGDVAASGGYYISAAADRIVAHPGTSTGSIGVAYMLVDFEELLDKIGVRLDVITAGEHKEMVVVGRLDDERRELLQIQADMQHEQFINAVAEGRGLEVSEVRRLATGELFIGEQAIENGLVDVLGGVKQAIAEAEELAGIQDAEIVEIRPGFWDVFFGGPGFSAADRLWPLRRAVEDLPDELLILREVLESSIVPRYQIGR
jgi:protease IV